MENGHMISSNGNTIEQNIGKKGIINLCQDLSEKYATKLSEKDMKDVKKIVKAAKAEDPLAQKVFYKMGKVLGECIVSSIRVLDVPDFIIGGGVSEVFHLMLPGIEKTTQKYLSPYYLERLNVQIATLKNI